MPNPTLLYPTVLFDWGDTLMRDYPERTAPMVEWERVEVIDEAASVLAYLHGRGRKLVLATSAAISDEGQIRGALARGGLDVYLSCIYGFKNTGLPKGEAFYRYILQDLGVSAAQTLMVGDGFENDVRVPNSLGMYAVWFNPRSEERRQAELYTTVHSMPELRAFFEVLDWRSP